MRRLLLACALAGPLAGQDLEKLFEQEWERSSRISPIFASTLGDRRYAQRWPDLSPAVLERDYRDTQAALARPRAIPPIPAQSVNRAVFERMLSEPIEEYELGWRFVPVNRRDGIQNTADLANLLNFRDERDYRDGLARLRAFPVDMDQTMALMREGIRRRLVQAERQLQSNPFLAPFASQSPILRNEAKLVIETAVFPSLRRFARFLETEHLPACQAPEGARLYAYFARSFTTTTLTPDEVHSMGLAMGLAEVARIRDEMHSVQRKAGFPRTLAEFFRYLRTDRRFFYASGEELFGMYPVNLDQPGMRPKWQMMALRLHEAAPGHHTEIAYAKELGIYDDPYAKFGQLTYEMWRAVRLVVDTGIHHQRWSRQQAIDYFLAHAPRSELDVTNEIDRYICWPGQALGYKIGELKIKELRRRAQAKLGARFDVRAFHDVVLSTGAVPLDVLEKRVMDWMNAY